MDEDFIERAGKLTESEVLAGIERARVKESLPPGYDGDCICGAAVPPQRIALGYYRCISCQTAREKRGRERLK